MFEQAAGIFVAQWITIFLLGTQSQHIRDGKKIHSAITSLLLGIAGWNSTGIISSAYGQGMLSVVFLAFIVAGPSAIVTSIYVHEHFHRKNK